MDKQEQPNVDQDRLLAAWQQTLPKMLNESDQAEVTADLRGIRIHIVTAGHTGYSFDFVCVYVDGREVKVELSDVEMNHRSVDERTEVIQQLIEDYIRHIHECAQTLQSLTHG